MAGLVFFGVLSWWWGTRLGGLIGDIIVDYGTWRRQQSPSS